MEMKEHRNLIGKTIIAAGILANAIESAGTSAGSQIAGAPRAMA